MAQACKEAFGAGTGYGFVYLFVVAHVVRSAGVFLFFAQVGVGVRYLIRIVAGNNIVVPILCIEADMYKRSVIIGAFASFGKDVVFITRYGHKIFVREIRMVDKNVMIRECNNGIACVLIKFFYLFYGIFAVRKCAVAVHICFEEASVRRKKIIFHNKHLVIVVLSGGDPA